MTALIKNSESCCTARWLFQVVFAVRTDEKEDLEFLEALLARHPGVYRRTHGNSIRPYQTPAGPHWQESYSITHANRIYVKIDDDIVFIQVRATRADAMPQCLHVLYKDGSFSLTQCLLAVFPLYYRTNPRRYL